MSRSVDQTLLQRMGFSDPDKKNPEHDLGCRYMCEPETREKLLQLMVRAVPAPVATNPNPYDDPLRGRGPQVGAGTIEVPIMKGQGQYMQYVGFVDAVLRGSSKHDAREPDRRGSIVSVERVAPFWFGVEVKIGESQTSEVVRQIKLYDQYREFICPAAWGYAGAQLPWVLATRYPMSKADVEVLRANRILHVRLGAGFEEYMARVRASEQSDSTEL
jgi:hypothetical protein